MYDPQYYQTRRQDLQARYSSKLNKLGQASLDFAADTQDLQRQLEELNVAETTSKKAAEEVNKKATEETKKEKK